jgi:D-alanine-D-alanine ligase-like ATP-grasp enzyme
LVHLTNNAIQKYADNYGNFEDGNQMSFDRFQQYLDDKNLKADVKGDLVHKMKSLIVRSVFATRKIIDPHKRKSCFELFGYDFILDEDFNVWLIEVNTNPCIEESSSILKVFLPRMINDMLKLSVDTIF